jgi:hypothetical protein
MELAWLFIRKPTIEAHERPTKEPDPVAVSDWAWAVMVTLAGCFTAYLVHRAPDADYASGRGAVYCWIVLAVVIIAPAYVLEHLLGRERANAVATVIVATLFCLAPLVVMAWPTSLRVLDFPLNTDTWKNVGKALGKVQGFATCWLFVTGLFALTAWWAAWVTFFGPQNTASRRRRSHRTPL